MLDAAPQAIQIPYKPRKHLIPIHECPTRFMHTVMHRRAGKSVGLINHTLRAALMNPRQDPPPRYAYIGPSFQQTKDLIWGYLKYYSAPIPGKQFKERDLQCILPNNAMISLYGGAQGYERMRGIYFDGAVMDEFPMLHPSMWPEVVRPCLSDYRGWAIASGTSKGDDHFHQLKKDHLDDPNWTFFSVPVTDTDALHPDEVEEMARDLTPAQYAREMMCDFSAPIDGAYYTDLMNDAANAGRICGVPHQPALPVYTWWDLGIADFMCVWFVQKAGQELHVIDYHQDVGKGLADTLLEVTGMTGPHEHRQKYMFTSHMLPHDVKARELGTGRSREEVFVELVPKGTEVFPVPVSKVEDGIEAVRSILPTCWFDEARCERGIMALRNYHANEGGRPVHNWASHGADAFRTGAIVSNWMKSGPAGLQQQKRRRRIRGLI